MPSYRLDLNQMALPNDDTHVDWFLLAIAERLEALVEEMGEIRLLIEGVTRK